MCNSSSGMPNTLLHNLMEFCGIFEDPEFEEPTAEHYFSHVRMDNLTSKD